jgi:hypothetical protein
MQSVGVGQQHAALPGLGAKMQGPYPFLLNNFYDALVIVALVYQQTFVFVHAE